MKKNYAKYLQYSRVYKVIVIRNKKKITSKRPGIVIGEYNLNNARYAHKTNKLRNNTEINFRESY